MRKLLVVQYEAPKGHRNKQKKSDEKRAASGNTKRLGSEKVKSLL
jgi:hypothetical protein